MPAAKTSSATICWKLAAALLVMALVTVGGAWRILRLMRHLSQANAGLEQQVAERFVPFAGRVQHDPQAVDHLALADDIRQAAGAEFLIQAAFFSRRTAKRNGRRSSPLCFVTVSPDHWFSHHPVPSLS